MSIQVTLPAGRSLAAKRFWREEIRSARLAPRSFWHWPRLSPCPGDLDRSLLPEVE